jgi:hypothetical protein
MPSSAANTYVTDAAFQPGVFQRNAFQVGDVMLQAAPQDVLFSNLARSVLDMWAQLFQSEDISRKNRDDARRRTSSPATRPGASRGPRSSARRKRAVAGRVRRLHDDPSRNRGQ